jgi:hypothetical protein
MKTDDLTQTERSLLARLYELSCIGNGTEMLELDAWASDTANPWDEVEWSYRDLSARGWLEKPVTSWGVRLTPDGICATEAVGSAPSDLFAANNHVREEILLFLADKKSQRQRASHEQLASAVPCDIDAVDRNGLLMAHFGLLTAPISGYFEVTYAGCAEAARAIRVRARLDRFAELKRGTTFTPQERGHEIEKLIEEVAKADGWESDRRVRGKGEEQDLVLHREREYYLVESKWLREKVEAGGVREFAGRVEARAGVRGLAMSMSGFSMNATDEARTKLSTCMLLLFGPQDVESLVTGKRGFTSLLDAKVHAVVARREIVWL